MRLPSAQHAAAVKAVSRSKHAVTARFDATSFSDTPGSQFVSRLKRLCRWTTGDQVPALRRRRLLCGGIARQRCIVQLYGALDHITRVRCYGLYSFCILRVRMIDAPVVSTSGQQHVTVKLVEEIAQDQTGVSG